MAYKMRDRTVELTNDQILDILKLSNGAKELLQLSPARLAEFLKSDELYKFTLHAESLGGVGRENFIKNMIELGQGRKFMDALKEAYSDIDAKNVRWSMGELFNRKIGQEILGGLSSWKTIINAPSIVATLYEIMAFPEVDLKNAGKIKKYDAELAKDYEHFKVHEIPVVLNEKERKLYSAMKNYMENGKEDAKSAFFRLAREDGYYSATRVVGSREGRELMRNAFYDLEMKKRFKELFLSEDGGYIMKNAVQTPEGGNSVAYLFNTVGGRKFVVDLFNPFKTNMLNAWALVKVFLTGQEENRPKFKEMEN